MKDRTQQEIEENILSKEAEISGILRAVPVGIGVVINRVIQSVNDVLCLMTGYSREELVGQGSQILYPTQEDYEYVGKEKYRQIIEHGTGSVETRWKCKDGHVIDIILSSAALDKSELVKGVIFTALDITGRKQAEEALILERAKLKNILDRMNDEVYIVNKNHDIEYTNPSLERDFGPVSGRKCFQYLHGHDESCPGCNNAEVLTGKTLTWEWTSEKTGKTYELFDTPIMNTDGSVSKLEIFHNITERKRMEAQLVIADRLVSLGELISGVAHELNNPLTGVIGFAELILEKDVPENIREEIAIIHHEAHRAAEVVKNLLTFARRHTPSMQLMNVNAVLAQVLALRAYEQKVNNIKVVTQLSHNLPQIMGDAFQIQQVFLNIIINAEYFMVQANNGGVLTISTELIDKMMRINFNDTGPGIPPENLGHIFDPFFTTKEAGKGTGLGLSISHGIVKEHNGNIYARSNPERGTTFVIELPLLASD